MESCWKFPRPSAELSRVRYDLIGVGLGISGAGIALDAATRGLSVIFVEMGDFASGTSSKSTKLIHGGFRYLSNLHFRVVLESVRERQLQQKLAPHMVWGLPFVIPTYSNQRLKNLKFRLGLTLYDAMAIGTGTAHPKHHTISREEVLRLCPGIESKGLTGGIVYTDCRTDDARHTLEVIKSACGHGAIALNYTKVVGLVHEDGRIAGVDVVDVLAPPEARPRIRLYGRVVVNATGVWTQKVSSLANAGCRTEVVPAKGIHITLSPDRLPLKSALIIPSVHDKRFCFAIPWYDSILVGTTDTAYDGDLEHVAVEPEEKRYILDALNAMFPEGRYTEQDITGEYAGLRPLIKDKRSTATADISRKHRLDISDDGLVSISGGKLTTYRRMAREVVDHIVSRCLPPAVRRRTRPCVTDRLMLGGWQAGDDVSGAIAVYRQTAVELGLAPDTAAYLPTVYGRRVSDLLKLVKGDPALGRKLSPAHPQILAQVLYGVWAEGARTVEDVLARRMRLAITDRRAAAAVCQLVADLMAGELGWNEDLKSSQVQQFLKEWL